MKTLSTVLREENITRKADILEFVKTSELIRATDKRKLDSSNVRFTYGDSKSSFRFDNSKLTQVYASDILVVSGGGNTIEDFGKKLQMLDLKITGIEKEKELIKAKIQYMQQSRATKFNEKEFRAYGVLQTIKQGGLNDFEKAKLISELIK